MLRPVQSKRAQRETRVLRRHTQRETQVLASALEFVFTAESNDYEEARRETDANDEKFPETGNKTKRKSAQ